MAQAGLVNLAEGAGRAFAPRRVPGQGTLEQSVNGMGLCQVSGEKREQTLRFMPEPEKAGASADNHAGTIGEAIAFNDWLRQ